MEDIIYMPARMLDAGVLYPIFDISKDYTYFNGIAKRSMAVTIIAEDLYLYVYLPKYLANICHHRRAQIKDAGSTEHPFNLCYYGKKSRTHILNILSPDEEVDQSLLYSLCFEQ